MANIALVAHVAAGSSGGTTVTTPNANMVGADFMFAALADLRSTTAVNISDTESNTYTNTSPAYNDGSLSRIRGSYVGSPTVDSSVAASYTLTNSFPSLALAGFSGVKASSFFDTQNGNHTTGSSTSLQPGSVTPSENGCLIVAAMAIGTVVTNVQIDSGFTLLDTIAFLNGNKFGLSIAYKVQLVAAAINPTWSWTVSSSFASAGIYVFKPAMAPVLPDTFPALMIAG